MYIETQCVTLSLARRDGLQASCACQTGWGGALCSEIVHPLAIPEGTNGTHNASFSIAEGAEAGALPAGEWRHALVRAPRNAKVMVVEMTRRCRPRTWQLRAPMPASILCGGVHGGARVCRAGACTLLVKGAGGAPRFALPSLLDLPGGGSGDAIGAQNQAARHAVSRVVPAGRAYYISVYNNPTLSSVRVRARSAPASVSPTPAQALLTPRARHAGTVQCRGPRPSHYRLRGTHVPL